VTVLVSGDGINELDETFQVSLADATNATIGVGQAAGTIVNDDAAPSIAIAGVSVNEGAAGTTAATFVLTLSAASDLPVSVTYATADGTAAAGSDYTAASGTASFAPGATTAEVTVAVSGDGVSELDETYTVTLANPTNATIATAQATGTIVNDDAVPSITIAGVSVNEGQAGTTAATFVLTLSAASELPVSVTYATADGTATAGSDYVTAAGTASFAPGATTAEVTVLVNADAVSELDESFTVSFADAVNATIAASEAAAIIANDDAAPSISIGDVSVSEGDAGTTAATFVLTLSAPSELPVSVSYVTADGTAVAGADYSGASGTVTFAADATTAEVTVAVRGDSANELDETFQIGLSDPTNATLARMQAAGTIVNDDPAPSMSISDVSVMEGSAETTTATFTVTLSAASDLPVSVNYATADGTAAAGSDYASAVGIASFAPGATSATVNVIVNGDVTPEVEETFAVVLTEPTNATIARAQGTGTIGNDDAPPMPTEPPTVSIGDASVAEGNSGTVDLTFEVTLSAASLEPVSVSYVTGDGTATAGADYASTSGTLTIAPGALSGTITIPVNGDTTIEPIETLSVTLTSVTNATTSRDMATGIIRNDDSLPGLVAAYNFDVQDAGVARDSSGNGLNGTISGAVWAEGRTGGALAFDGLDDWVTIADDNRLDVARMTIAAWIRPTTSGAWDAVIAKSDTSGPAYALYSSNGAHRPSTIVAVSGNEREVEGPVAVPTNAWTHIAASFDGARVRLYVNGVLVRIGVRTGSIDATNGTLGIGGHQALGHYFAGTIDDVRLYSRALLDSEVQADMNAPVP
jgi:chitinase